MVDMKVRTTDTGRLDLNFDLARAWTGVFYGLDLDKTLSQCILDNGFQDGPPDFRVKAIVRQSV